MPIKITLLSVSMLFLSAACGIGTNTSSNTPQNHGAPDLNRPQKVPQEQNWDWVEPLMVKVLNSTCEPTKKDLENGEQIKFIVNPDSNNQVFILKKISEDWVFLRTKSTKGMSGSELSSLIIKLTAEARSCLKFVKNIDRTFECTYRFPSGSFGGDGGIKQENFETFVKIASQNRSDLFPNGYTKQLDTKGDFIVD